MGFINRFINIVKTNINSKKHPLNSFDNLTTEQLDFIIADDYADKLKNEINNLKANITEYPPEVINAFRTLNINPTNDFTAITTAFRHKIKQCHPDNFIKSAPDVQKSKASQTNEILRAFDIIKNYSANSK